MRKYDLTAIHTRQRAVAGLQPRTPTELSANELGAGQGYLLQAEARSGLVPLHQVSSASRRQWFGGDEGDSMAGSGVCEQIYKDLYLTVT